MLFSSGRVLRQAVTGAGLLLPVWSWPKSWQQRWMQSKRWRWQRRGPWPRGLDRRAKRVLCTRVSTGGAGLVTAAGTKRRAEEQFGWKGWTQSPVLPEQWRWGSFVCDSAFCFCRRLEAVRRNHVAALNKNRRAEKLMSISLHFCLNEKHFL